LFFGFLHPAQINFAKGVDPFAECRMSKALGNSNIGGEFELINQDGQMVTDKDILKSRPSYILVIPFAQTYALGCIPKC